MTADRLDELDPLRDPGALDRFAPLARQGTVRPVAPPVPVDASTTGERVDGPVTRPRHGGHVAARDRARARAELGR